MNTSSDMKKEALIEAETMLTTADVCRMFGGISKAYLSRLTNHRNPAMRIPSHRFGAGKVLYDINELRHYKETHRYEPKKKRRG